MGYILIINVWFSVILNEKIINSNELMASLIKKVHESHQSFENLKIDLTSEKKYFKSSKKLL
jgi:hypothetical protein